jgi:hypothetical protein
MSKAPLTVATQKLITEFYDSLEQRLCTALETGRDLAIARSAEMQGDCLTWDVEYLAPGAEPTPGREWTLYRLEDLKKCPPHELSSR